MDMDRVHLLVHVLAQRRIRIPLPGRSGRIKIFHREWRLAPTNFTRKLALQLLAVEFSESGPILESRLLRQYTLEDMTNLSRTESPRRGGRNKSNHGKGRRRAAARVGGGRGVWERDGLAATS
ncbi:hypothetical protein F511_41405 [Dorcoceras hygrometricum]|uniref:Uncharacterized protein n=1 Tax=Dorcoceras hygrometricum TaxID=472368 RepID=A0A2Z7AUV1_9LAMI|nr:hypothetical protein F511_41405 [Dorcoceras hygrometricum]